MMAQWIAKNIEGKKDPNQPKKKVRFEDSEVPVQNKTKMAPAGTKRKAGVDAGGHEEKRRC